MKIKKGDIVAVISGKHKPVNGKYTTGEVLQVLPNSNRVVVKGVNIVTKHNRPSNANPDGGIEKKEAPIHISNVALIDPKTKKSKKAVKTVRVGFDFENGKKIRVCHKTGAKLD
jgi:large subunit ribosomal protein L24